ncbi:unnamed protein product [Ophioblennius macclurei]
MKLFVALCFLLGIPSGAPVLHSLKYFVTASSGVPNFPEFVSVGLVDGLQIEHYDSNIGRLVPKQEWMNRVTEEDPNYWKKETDVALGTQKSYKANIEIVKQRMNQTGGVHIFQHMYGCEWDDETGEVNGYRQYGFDGEDFIALDLKTETWIAPVPEAVISKHKWDNDRADLAYEKHYFTQAFCPDWLKKYVKLGESSLMRKDLPSVSLLQKTPSSPVTCHATGFYPHRADLFWTKDGVELHEDVVRGEVLPNHDGSFQTSVDLLLNGVKEEDWERYSCVFHLDGVQEDVLTKLDKKKILTNRDWIDPRTPPKEEGFPVGAVVGGVAAGLLVVAGIIGLIVWKKKNQGFKRANNSENSSASGDTAKEGSSEERSMLPSSA